MTRRRLMVEYRFLTGACSMAREPRRRSCKFAGRVMRRLDRAGIRFGRDLPRHMTLREVLDEAREECEDIPGWALMAVHLARERELEAETRDMLERRLQRAAAFAVLADRELHEALIDLRLIGQ